VRERRNVSSERSERGGREKSSKDIKIKRRELGPERSEHTPFCQKPRLAVETDNEEACTSH
jgi:hypothetical protein